MSDIVLSASVRQNLLSLQSTADLLATTQNRLATGNKVNTALDNPTNYFTAQSLNNRASDISNLLDGIGNGVQVLQAANTGITSLQKLVDSAKSVANQALQSAVGYSSKSTVTTSAIAGATADNLLGTSGFADVAATAGSAQVANTTAAFTSANALGAAIGVTVTGSPTNAAATNGTALDSDNTGTAADATTTLASLFDTSNAAISLNGKSLTVNGQTITIDSSHTGAASTVGSTTTLGTDLTLGDLRDAIDAAQGNTSNASTINATDGSIDLNTGTANDLTISGTLATALGLTSKTRTPGAVTHPLATGSTTLASLTTALADGNSFKVNGQTITFSSSVATSTPSATGGTINLGTGHLSDVVAAINAIAGSGAASVDGAGKLSIDSGTVSNLTITDGSSANATASLGLTAVVTHGAYGGGGGSANAAVTGGTLLSGSASTSSNSLSTAFSASDTIVVDGKTISFAATGSTSTSATGGTINFATGSVQDVVDAIDKITGTFGGSNASTIDATTGAITLHTGTTADLAISGTGLAKLGLGSVPASTARTVTGGLSGLILTIGATGNGTATNITFGNGAGGTVKSLNDLNNKLSANNLLATIDTSGAITISTTNDAASATIGTIGGSAAGTGKAFAGLAGGAAIQDASAQLIRSNLVDQYNNILDQITTTAQDASYNGVGLLNGDQLKLTFNETGSSTLKIQGVTFSSGGLGLSKLTEGTDFLDNASATTAINSLNTASNTLRTEASALGSNLSIVQIRQDFSKNLINVLQTGSSNLTLADTNEEAANSQALSTRQSIAVSALALANQSQQSVLQLLR